MAAMNNPNISYHIITLTIPKEADGKSLEHYLKYSCGYSRRMLTRLKARPENVLRNGIHINLPEIVSVGDTIQLSVEEITYTIPGQAGTVPIIYEDDDILIYNKPYDMPIHPSRNHQQDTLANVFTADMKARGLSIPFRVLNRLDRDTSGLCLCAKNAVAANRLSVQQQDGTLQKLYTAILNGKLPCQSGIIEAPIARKDDFYIDRVVRADGQYAKTAFRVLMHTNEYTVVNVNLYTGRTHQIRVHFSAIGYPLAGDTLYGSKNTIQTVQNHHALCCTGLSFIHPTSMKRLDFSAPIRPDMAKLVAVVPNSFQKEQIWNKF